VLNSQITEGLAERVKGEMTLVENLDNNLLLSFRLKFPAQADKGAEE